MGAPVAPVEPVVPVEEPVVVEKFVEPFPEEPLPVAEPIVDPIPPTERAVPIKEEPMPVVESEAAVLPPVTDPIPPPAKEVGGTRGLTTNNKDSSKVKEVKNNKPVKKKENVSPVAIKTKPAGVHVPGPVVHGAETKKTQIKRTDNNHAIPS